jgi:hypothetical protein
MPSCKKSPRYRLNNSYTNCIEVSSTNYRQFLAAYIRRALTPFSIKREFEEVA